MLIGYVYVKNRISVFILDARHMVQKITGILQVHRISHLMYPINH